MIKIVKKLIYYRDIKLFFRIFLVDVKLGFRGWQSFIPFKKIKTGKHRIFVPIEKTIKYVKFYLYLRQRLGIGITCLKRSFLLCHMIRSYGQEAVINFGVIKQADKLVGHCWVKDIDTDGEYEYLFSYS